MCLMSTPSVPTAPPPAAPPPAPTETVESIRRRREKKRKPGQGNELRIPRPNGLNTSGGGGSGLNT